MERAQPSYLTGLASLSAQIQWSSNPNLQKFSDSIHKIEYETYSKEDTILDTSFAPEEVRAAIRLLKKGSSAGPDLLSPCHLLHAGPSISIWLSMIFNAMVNLEATPSVFKKGILIPIYKGKGKDPTSYIGITLTSVIAKTFEILLLDRILPILSDRNIPQLTQTAYRRGVSCQTQPSRAKKPSPNSSVMVTPSTPASMIWPLHLTLWNIQFFSLTLRTLA